MLQHLQHSYAYDVLDCYTEDPNELADDSGRSSKREVILQDRLKAAVVELNPEIPEAEIDEALRELCDKRQTLVSIERRDRVSICCSILP